LYLASIFSVVLYTVFDPPSSLGRWLQIGTRAKMSHSCDDQELIPRCWLGKVPGQPPLNLSENIIEYPGVRGDGCCKAPWKVAASFYLQSDGLTLGKKRSTTNT